MPQVLNFGKCMPILDKYLGMGLQNVRDYQVFAVTVEVVGDICRALDEKILPFCDGIMSHLLTDLSSDIGIAIGKHFEKYLPYVMPMIQVASEICAEMDTANEAMMNYRNQLMSGIFDAYSGILQGLKNLKSELMLPYAGHLLQVIKLVIKEKTRQESVSKAAVAAMGDLAHTLGPNVKLLFKDRALYADFLRECLDSDDYKMKEIATWTQRTMKHGFVCERPACR
ncbi:hypothetical protein MKW92_023276 [Papaver armeniacum]|nr:hypothetical protein MKW92_023276 [Papaver armeniacum]